MSFSNNSDLPPEILCEIFSFLSTDDRLNVRLTCRRFYELCDEIKVQRNEELVFHGNLNTGSALQLLSSSPRRMRNLRFNHVYIEDTVLPYFNNHGRNIHSLSLQNCRFHQPGLFGRLLEQCTALRNFHLKVPRVDRPYQYVFCDIRALSENSIIFDQVVDFRLHVGRNWYEEINPQWSNQIFLRCLALFPKVKKLDLKFDVDESFDYLSTSPSDIATDDEFTASCIYDRILALGNQLEKLRLHLHSSHYAHSYSTTSLVGKITEIEMTSLKELSLNFRDIPNSLTPNPYLAFKNLTHIHCDFDDRRNISPSVEIQLILNSIPGLVSLVYLFSDFSGCEPLSRPCFEALLASRLTSLRLEAHVRVDFEELSLKDTFEPNYRLEHLCIHTTCNDVIQLFASHFRSLKHITFLTVDEITLHTIFRTQNNLRSLKLYNGKCNSLMEDDHNFTYYKNYKRFLRNDNMSRNRRLPRLTHLQIDEDRIGLTKFLLTEFRFPLLKSLTISLHWRQINFERFLKILTRIPQVKFIKLRCTRTVVSFEQLSSMIRTLPNLCHLVVRDAHDNRPKDTSEYHKLFNVSSSLRTVTHRDIEYFRDTTNRLVREIRFKSSRFRVGKFCDGIPHHYEHNNKCFNYYNVKIDYKSK